MAKGSSFERDVCKLLSRWWSHNKRDDIFWRTSGSGARATKRKGKKTFGQYGDVQAIDPVGQPLIDMICFELKKGYCNQTFANLIEKSQHPKATSQGFDSFVLQTMKNYGGSSSKYWAIITKRSLRDTLITIPFCFYQKLRKECKVVPCYYIHCQLSNGQGVKLFGTTLAAFLETVTPETILKIHKGLSSPQVRNASPSDREAQVFKCEVCDENEVVWDDKNWQCRNCKAINDYPK